MAKKEKEIEKEVEKEESEPKNAVGGRLGCVEFEEGAEILPGKPKE